MPRAQPYIPLEQSELFVRTKSRWDVAKTVVGLVAAASVYWEAHEILSVSHFTYDFSLADVASVGSLLIFYGLQVFSEASMQSFHQSYTKTSMGESIESRST